MNDQRPHGSTPGPQAGGPQDPQNGSNYGPQGGYGPPQGPNGPYGGYNQQGPGPYQQQQWQQQPPPKKKNWFLRHKFLTALLALLLIIIISVAANGGSKKSDSGSGSPAATSGGSQPTTKGSGEATTDAKNAAPAAIGTPVRDGKFEFTVTSVERGKKSVGQQYLEQTAQGQYTVVHVTVKNIGDQQQTLSDGDQKAMDAEGTQYAADSAAGAYINNNQMLFNQINPGNQVKGTLVFDAPVGKKLTKIEFHDSMFSGGVTAAL